MSSRLAELLHAAQDEHVPINVLFELTNRCNEDCRHCYVDLGDVDGELTTAEVIRILDELREAGTLFLTFTGGEIFTRRDILTLIDEARRRRFALRLFTNGTLIGPREVEAIAAAGVVAVELSLYAMDPAVHDAVTRRPGSHAKTVRAAERLRAAGVPVVLKAPILRSAGEAYREVVAFARKIGAEYRFDPSVVARYDLDETPLAERIDGEALQRACADPDLGLAADPASRRPPDPGDPICATGRRVALISARGLVYPCSQRFPPAGSLREQSFREIWETSPLLLRLRNLTAQDLPVCSRCPSHALCGRCSLDALFEDGDFWGSQSRACAVAEARLSAGARGGTTLAQRLRGLPGCGH